MQRIVTLCLLLLSGLGPVNAAPAADISHAGIVARHSGNVPDRPLRIVSLEAITTEMLLALGVVPVGVGGLDAYRQQDKPGHERLEDSAAIGSDQQPNLEQLIMLQPDLVIGTTSLHSGLFERLSSLAPTLLYDVSLAPAAGDALDQGEAMLRHMAALTDRKEQADQVLERLQQAIRKGQQAAQEAGVTGQPLAVLYPLPTQGLFIVSHENTLVVSLANRLGGTNPWPLRDARNIHHRIEIHELAKRPDLHLMFIGGFEGAEMFDSGLWQALPVARNGRYGFLPTDYWSFGGVLTAENIMSQMTRVLEEMKPQ